MSEYVYASGHIDEESIARVMRNYEWDAGQCADAIGRLCDLLVNTGTLEPASVLEALGLREWSARPVEGDQP